VPAVLISTAIGALNGYVLSMWRFRGSQLFFGLLLFGCFLPFQTVLLPASFTLGKLGLASTTSGLVLVHVVYGLAFTTLFFRNYYVSIPMRWSRPRAWTVPVSSPSSAHHAADVDADHHGLPDLAVHPDLERLPVRRGVLQRRLAADHGGAEQPGQHQHRGQGIQRGHGSGDDRRLPTLLVYVVAGKYFVRGLTAGAVKG
jgi:glucose/mannose transport system permease protein